jgi:hypothetical protein
MKNFGKFIYTEAQPFIPVMKAFKQGGEIAGDIFWNLNKLDNPKINDVEKASAIFDMATSPLSLVPLVGTMVDLAGIAAPYITGVIEGRKDPPPVSSDINSKINPIGNIGNKVIGSSAFKNFFRNW